MNIMTSHKFNLCSLIPSSMSIICFLLFIIGYGPLTYKNDSNKNEFITAMSLLNVFGGRDCPEMSFTGMLEAFKANPQLGSPMFVFTDASPKDDSPANMQKLKTEASQYSTAINFFTNQDGCGDEKGQCKLFTKIALNKRITHVGEGLFLE